MTPIIPKLGNPLEPVNRVSDLSSNTKIPNTNISYSLPTNFIDINGKNPNLKDKISIKNVTFHKEELTEHNWLFTLQEYRDVVEKVFKTPSNWKWIVIRSDEMIEEIAKQEKLKYEKEEQTREERYDKHKMIADTSKIDPKLIISKFHTIEDFQESHPEYNGQMLNLFQKGDEIWHYDDTISEEQNGCFIECFLLIRNHTILYSPLLQRQFRDCFGGYRKTNEIITPTFHKSSNFINNKGEHPMPQTIIRYNKIAFNKEELKDNQWLYVGKEPIDNIKAQFKELRHKRLWFYVEE